MEIATLTADVGHRPIQRVDLQRVSRLTRQIPDHYLLLQPRAFGAGDQGEDLPWKPHLSCIG